MSQTYALLMDAYRELNAKKLFWISLILSGLIVLVIAAIGIDRDGFSIFGWTPAIFETNEFDSVSDEALNQFRSEFYKSAFNIVGITIWLTWAAIILAIFSTAGIFPDLMTSGTIDTLLTKPIGRLRLFLTKYFLGMGFVGLQVAVFSVCAFFVIGLRASDWEPRMFLAIPIVLLFFSYLYAVSVLIGVLTRSTLLAVIGTAVVWVGMFVVNITDDFLLAEQARALVEADVAEQRVDYMQTLPTLADLEARAAEDAPAEPGPTPGGPFDRDLSTREGYAAMWGDAPSLRDEAASARERAEAFDKWRGYAYLVKSPLPKTGETRTLITRLLVDDEQLDKIEFDPTQPQHEFRTPLVGNYGELMNKQTLELVREQRGWLWIVMTSILFEVAVVGFAGWVFCRRDY